METTPIWSTDGEWVIYATKKDLGFEYTLYAMGSDGSSKVRITPHQGGDLAPAWKPGQ